MINLKNEQFLVRRDLVSTKYDLVYLVIYIDWMYIKIT